MILTYPVLSVWSKNQPFPQKALSTSRSDNLTLHTKDTLVLLLVRLVSKAGPSRNCSLLSTKGGTQVGYFKKKKNLPLPLSLVGSFTCSWAYYRASEVCSMLSNEIIYFHWFRKRIFWVPICETVCWLKAWCCYSRRLQALDARTLSTEASSGLRKGAGLLPTTCCQ